MLIDGHSMAFRAFYALPAEKFATSAGQHTNAVYGFCSMLSALLSQEQPTHVVVAFDIGRKTFRTDMFPEYKAQREATPEAFKGQVEILQELLPALGITCVTKENFEADDIIATLATQAGAADFSTVIVTGDRDSFQLVNDATTVLYPVKGVSEMRRFTPAAIEEKYGLTPAQYPDFAALRGDPSDNLPNIPGVGEKTATKWIVQYGTLHNLLDHADEIGGKVGQSLRDRIDQVRLNRQLTAMIRDVQLPITVDDGQRRAADPALVHQIFQALEFGSTLRNKLATTFDFADDNATQTASPEQPAVTVHLDTDVSLASWLTEERMAAGIAVVAAGDAQPSQGTCTMVALAAADGHCFVFDPSELDCEQEQIFAEFVQNSQAPKFTDDAKSLWHQLQGHGYTLQGLAHDTGIAAYLVDPDARLKDLDSVVSQHLPMSLQDLEHLLSGGKPQKSDADQGQQTLVDLPSDPAMIHKLAARAAAVVQLADVLTGQLVARDCYELFVDMELPLAMILARMEHTGIAVDRAVLLEQRDTFIELVDAEVAAARAIAGDEELNLSSPKQLQTVLFDTLQLPKTKKIKTGYSTAAKELEALAAKTSHPFLAHLMAHREYLKMKTTLDGLLKAIGDDGRIHTTFKQTAAATGRLSSTEPNLQNIPVRTAQGREIRSAFIASGSQPEGNFTALLTADYSQIEMRVMTHLSQDAGLIEAYQQGEDLHNYVGSKVFNVPVAEVTPEIRRKVKAMSYGLAYGLTAFGLAAQLGTSTGEASTIMESYFQRFGGVKRYLETVVAQARDDGYTTTVFGRRRYLPELVSTNRLARENAERAALNSPIQGTAADIIKVAMIRVDEALRGQQLASRVLLQVHDELVVEVADGELETVRELVQHHMDQAIALRVPLEVSTGVGPNWDAAAH
ncbi:DNA polymerase I [Corynebacterium choanae]|nr:DNA polymerase I [Corynebacterium choanae]